MAYIAVGLLQFSLPKAELWDSCIIRTRFVYSRAQIWFKLLGLKVLLLSAFNRIPPAVLQTVSAEQRLVTCIFSVRSSVEQSAHTRGRRCHAIPSPRRSTPTRAPPRRSTMSHGKSPTFYQWEYKGVCKEGATLQHDVFGLCTLLESKDAPEVCETTRGHVQVVCEISSVARDESGGGGGGNPKPVDNDPGNNGTLDSGKESAGTDEQGGTPSNENNKDDATTAEKITDEKIDEDNTKENAGLQQAQQALFDQVIASVAAQASEFCLDLSDGKAELLYWRTLVLIDTPAVLSSPAEKGGVPHLRVGQIVRERTTRLFMVICKLLKPLLSKPQSSPQTCDCARQLARQLVSLTLGSLIGNGTEISSRQWLLRHV
eukprot:6175773-Pleurochrysis_carterae.AAC.1